MNYSMNELNNYIALEKRRRIPDKEEFVTVSTLDFCNTTVDVPLQLSKLVSMLKHLVEVRQGHYLLLSSSVCLKMD